MKETEKSSAPPTIDSLPVLFAYALALELEASERYEDLADQMNNHNNPEVADLFQKLSHIEKLHVDHVLAQTASMDLPDIAASAYQWQDAESPETTDLGEAHYMMTPHHALKLALHNERRAKDFFAKVAANARDPGVGKFAMDMAEEEQEHVILIKDWLTRYPEPEDDWSYDLDPPVGLD